MRILGAVMVVAVFFLVKTAFSNASTKSDRTPPAEPTYNTPTVAVKDNGLQDAISSCVNGALFNTLSISPDYAPDRSDTNQFGHDRIAVK